MKNFSDIADILIDRIVKFLKSNVVLRVIFNTSRDFYNDDCFTLGASISFNFLLSFIPFLILLGSVMGYAIDYIQEIRHISAAEMAGQTMDYIQFIIPYLEKDYILQFFEISKYKFSLGTIGGISLIVSATLLFSSLHFSFFKIFGGNYINFIFSRLLGVLFIITTIILLFFCHYFTIIAISIIEILQRYFPPLELIINIMNGNWSVISPFISTALIIVFFNILIFYFTSAINLKQKSILAGALLFSFLWNSAKYIFNLYISKLSDISVVYGSATWLIAVTLWIYYSIVILLLAMEFIKAINLEFSAGTKKIKVPK